MHRLFSAVGLSALLAPVLAAPFMSNDQVGQERDIRVVRSIDDRRFGHVNVELPRGSPDANAETLGFQIEILNSETACGFGNVTVAGTVLPQTVAGDVSTGKGSVPTTTKSIVLGSWEFHCIRVSGVPDAQLMKFAIESVDGRAIENTGFSLLYRQSGLTEILTVETDLSVPDEVVANPNRETLQRFHEAHEEHDAERAELGCLWSQLREIKYLIRQKERLLAQREFRQAKIDITDCDSLRCFARAMAQQAKHAAYMVYGKINGDAQDFDDSRQHRNGPFGKHHGSECGNHTPRGHGPPHRGQRPHFPPPLPPHHGENGFSEFDGPSHHRSHGEGLQHGPERSSSRPPPPPPHPAEHGGPEFDHGPPPPHPPHHMEPDHEEHGPPPPRPPPRHDSQHRGPRLASALFSPGPPDPHHHSPTGSGYRALQIITLTTLGLLCAFLLAALHRRLSAQPQHRSSRREERRRRRARRREAHKNIITRLLARMSLRDENASEAGDDVKDDEEKRQPHPLPLSDAEEATRSPMPSALPTAPQPWIPHPVPISIPISGAGSRPPVAESDPSPPVSDRFMEEALPAYYADDTDVDDAASDEYECGCLVADGMRYLPGTGTQYAPSVSSVGVGSTGSVSGVWGPDVKN
ncbi:uncharacterized protein L3040_002080 [Drepanopeziza brunnea f. sp. 'multigermtubi']|uniref:Uncharacterized protein n=1 Tax=Marssonina brunnea f. sp. multigermtubi (strain MB_m1) TaxID=1072389 RepID=K1Y0N9_MARBU|nr:uncharacterized protein MBM_02896 [Drepanopeziza brunnea f. sp. 'multigermtubi' MB_m1]EKD18654.1 hypothetical protein MBM_02896 [Drepanopeziza brunnea f. sp. 'multigermtubi' MB_m1]KAJ5052328.1 hypothetical protein L3040_002080 [Drepanopeziza brunnea f. sp. 'multigermtubi']